MRARRRRGSDLRRFMSLSQLIDPLEQRTQRVQSLRHNAIQQMHTLPLRRRITALCGRAYEKLYLYIRLCKVDRRLPTGELREAGCADILINSRGLIRGELDCMSCAQDIYFEKGHIQSSRFAASAELAEQAVYCLELVAELVDVGLPFQFKGGNSLLLILDKPARFSIDVDIATDEPRERVEEALDALVTAHGRFVRWEKRQHRTKPWLPIASYYCWYHSCITSPREQSVMLDVQLRRSPYVTASVPVVCGRLYRSAKAVETPVPSSIISDKLLTIGPYTLGIPIGKGKEAQRLKHVFDIARLSETRPHLDEMRRTFSACLAQENSIQDNKQSETAVLEDTLRFCGSVRAHTRAPADEETLSPVLRENVRGLQSFAGHLFESDYNWSRLQLDCARAALCISAINVDTVRNQDFQSALHTAHDCDGMENSQTTGKIWRTIEHWLGGDPAFGGISA